jgi:hypothetical protein
MSKLSGVFRRKANAHSSHWLLISKIVELENRRLAAGASSASDPNVRLRALDQLEVVEHVSE